MHSACFVLHGVSAAPGIAIARAQLVSHVTLEVAHYDIAPEHIGREQARLTTAIETVQTELQGLQTSMMQSDTPAELGAFLDVHWMLLTDPSLSKEPLAIISKLSCNAEWAITQQMNELVAQFEAFEDPYLRERKADVVHVVERVLKALSGQLQAAPAPRDQQTVLVAHDLSPADVIQYKGQHFAAFITDVGGITSHTAIVARSLGIPSVVALHDARSLVRENEWIIVDGDAGLAIVNPDEATLAEYRLKQDGLQLAKQKLRLIIRNTTETLDGQHIQLNANIELPDDLAAAIDNGAEGIGLFRSEFLYLNRQDLPSEDEQFEAYRSVIVGMSGKPVTIRTFDLGADKRMPGVGDRVSVNPALGLRAIRLCLVEPKLFLTQLRALLRASAFGPLKILVPMLASASEWQQTQRFIAQAKQQLTDKGHAYGTDIQVGGMVEVPASVLSLDYFAKQLDFLSVGTNDLIQYTLAIDRGDDAVAHLYDPLHPAVLRLLSMAFKAADKAECPIAVCGETAGDPKLTRVLLGLGLREFSMHPANLLAVKQRVLSSNVAECQAVMSKVLKLDEPSKMLTLINRLNEF
jgi:phosphoenolpyruvate-protein phosphotransferase (PTS system enzyme I)